MFFEQSQLNKWTHFLVVSITILISLTFADVETHEYTPGEEVIVWVNKIGPFNNPQETYTYNTLPFCRALGAEEPEAHALGIGEILEGNELFNSGLQLKFGINTPKTTLCQQILTDADALQFGEAVDEHYWYQMSVDDLPVWGLVGKVMKPTDDDEYLKVFPVESRIYIHWFSIFNSFMMVIFLCGLVALILLRTLKNDYARFAEDDTEEMMMDGKSSLLKDDANSGWKLLHGDVFRAPPYLLLFTALVGTGAQLLVLSDSLYTPSLH
ncbi:unnamed protein product [Peronospora belbahrii]|uniref:Transmembrane 9 superfamily member n=1 Tax=Peronospora belbahrii TaxID=622444 RepID=A0ABN8D6K7_9STRA|nr:unnamed protein product [Peronospora belbahrii]